jgi:hypothetical protein
MRKFSQYSVIFITVVCMLYLAFAFVSMSLNPQVWHILSRALLSLVTLAWMVWFAKAVDDYKS